MTTGLRFDGLEPDENLYAPPKAEFLEPSAADLAEGSPAAIRHAFYRREKTIKRIAWINLILAIVWFPAAVGSVLFLAISTLQRAGIDIPPAVRLPPTMPTGVGLMLLTAFHNGIFGLTVALFLGLRALRWWARWAMVGLASIVLLAEFVTAYFVRPGLSPLAAILVGVGVLVAVIIYLLISFPSGMVFTREYRDAVARTRGMRF